MKARSKMKSRPIRNGRQALWQSGESLFQNQSSSAQISINSSIDRFDMLAPLAEGEDLFRIFDTQADDDASRDKAVRELLAEVLGF